MEVKCVSIFLIFYYSSTNTKFMVSPVNGSESGPGYSYFIHVSSPFKSSKIISVLLFVTTGFKKHLGK
jgi:hypothetical protein